MNDARTNGLVNYALERGGDITPLIIDSQHTNGTGLMNPSICVVNNQLLVNVRHVNYTFYHSEKNKFPHTWGPLIYVHPEDDVNLKTENFICHLDCDLNITEQYSVEMTFNKKPIWNFVGLEDARLIYWDEKLYMCGVRRDHIDNKGTGRMDLSEVILIDGKYVEISRESIPAINPDSYCEKNWMPVLDQPYHFVKWTNPTDVVAYDKTSKQTNQIHLDESNYINMGRDLRGGSHVFKVGENYFAFTHEVILYLDNFGRKNGRYLHRLVMWDKDWNLIRYSDDFSFMKGEIEFVTGAALYGDDLLISFGYQDNCAYIMKLPQKYMMDLLTNEVYYG